MIIAALLAIVLAQLGLMAYFFTSATRERAELLQRIQAPQAAVIAHQIAANPTPLVEPLEFDNDEMFHASREDLAQALENDHR